jgi:HK97 family phage portal protein
MEKKRNFIQRFAANVIKNEMDEAMKQFVTGEDTDEVSKGVINVSGNNAMKYSAVFACVRVLSETMASMPMILYKKNNDGGREAVTDLPIYDVFHNKPNDEMSAYNFKETCMVNLNLGGNAVCEKIFNSTGDIIGLYPYPYQYVKIERNKTSRKLEYKIKMPGTEERILTRDKVFHIPGLSFDGIVGMSPIEYSTKAIRLGMSYEEFGNKFYENGANPSGSFQFPNVLSDAAFERLKKDLNKSYSGLKNTGKPMLLEEGGKFEPFTMKPIDAQMIESKYFQLEDIARIYRVPQHMINKMDKATFSNIEHQSLEFVMYSMMPWFKRWEENANTQTLTDEQRKAGYFWEIKVDALLRGDSKSRNEAYAIARNGGWKSVNDIRRLENDPPIENGDIYLQPLNYTEAGTDDSKDIPDDTDDTDNTDTANALHGDAVTKRLKP